MDTFLPTGTDRSPLSLPNRLLAPDAVWQPKPVPWLYLGLILLLGLSLRVLMATKIDTLCNDGVLYAQLALSIENGDLVNGTREVRLNTLSLVLAVLHSAGLSWEMAGRVQGVTCSTLAILPLFGWIRRQFDDRIAVIACILYAAHPTVIKWSPEMVRDSLFALFAASTLYFAWRAACELRPRFYVATAVMFVLAAHTRVEAIFLLLPMAAWSARRSLALRQQRWRPWAGLACSAAVCGALLLAIAGLVHWQTGHWTSIRSTPFALAADFAQRLLPFLPQTDGQEEKAIAAATSIPPLVDLSISRRGYILLNTLERGLSPFYALFSLGGIVWAWRVWARSDSQPNFVVSLVVIASMWIHLGYAGISSTRYVLTIVMLGLPFAAMGIWGLSQAISRLAAQSLRRDWRQQQVATCLLVALVLFGTAIVAHRHVARRTAQAEVGRWLLVQNGPQMRVLGTDDLRALLVHYGRAQFISLAGSVTFEQLQVDIRHHQPDALILSTAAIDSPTSRQLKQCQESLGYRLVDAREVGTVEAHVLLLVRNLSGTPAVRRNIALSMDGHRKR